MLDAAARLGAAALAADIVLILADESRCWGGYAAGDRPCTVDGQLLQEFFRTPIPLSAEPLAVDDVREHAELREHPVLRRLGVAAFATAPLHGRGGDIRGAIFAFGLAPRAWGSESHQLILDAAAVSGAQLDALELMASDRGHYALLETASDGMFWMDADGVILTANSPLARIFGYRREELVGQPLGMLIPERFHTALNAGLRNFLATGGPKMSWTGMELLGRRREGHEVPIEISFGGYADKDGEPVFTGTIREVGGRASAASAIRGSEQRLHSLVSATTQILWTSDAAGSLGGEQPAWRGYTGQTEEEYRGRGWLRAVHPDDRARVRQAWKKVALEGGDRYEQEYRLRRHDGEYRDFSVVAVPLRGDDGEIREWVGTHTDITRRRRAEQDREFLIRASEVLTSSLGYELTLQNVARLAVEHLADWCTIDVLKDGLERVATAHRDPARRGLAERLLLYPLATDAPVGPTAVVRTGVSALHSEISDSLLASFAHDAEHLALLRQLGLRSGIVVPLVARGTVVGVLSLASAESARRYDAEDLALAEDLARRAAVAVDTARLFHELEHTRDTMELQAVQLEENLDELRSSTDQVERSRAELQRVVQELQRTIAELTSARAQIEHILAASPAVTYSLRVAGEGLVPHWVGPNITKLMGYSIADALAPDWWTASVHPDGRAAAEAGYPVLFETGAFAHEYRFRHADGTYRWIRDTLRLIRDADGNPAEVVGSWMDISQQKEAERALLETEQRLGQIAENIREIFWMVSADFSEVLYLSPSYEDLWGISTHDAYRSPRLWIERIHPDDLQRVRTALTRATEGFPAEAEFRVLRPDGSVRWACSRAFPMYSEEGSVASVVGTTEDVTDRKLAEADRRTAEARYRRLVDTAPQAIFAVDGQGRLTELNPAGERLLERSAADVLGQPVQEILCEESLAAASDALAGLAERNEFDLRIRRPSGECRLVRINVSVLMEDGVPAGAHGVARDITSEREAEEALQLAHARYRRLVENAPSAVYALDPAGRLAEVNDAAREMLGRDTEQLLGMRFADVVAPEDAAECEAAFGSMLAGQAAHAKLELKLVHASGTHRIVDVRAVVIRENGVVTGAHGIAHDVTEERAWQGQMRLLAVALEGLDEGVTISTPEGRLVYANSTHARLLGYDRTGPLPYLRDLMPPEDADEFGHVLRVAAEEGSWRGRGRRRRLDTGEIIPVGVIIGRVEVDGENLFVAIARDLRTELKQEEQLRRAERLASVGTLVGGVAHELNNPLHAIRNFAELLLMDERSDDDREAMEIIQREAERAAKVVSDLRLIARQTQDESDTRDPVDLNDVVRHVIKVRRYTLETSNVEVRFDLAAELPPVLANRAAIEQVVLNLVVNAEQAMAGQLDPMLLVLRTRRTPEGAALHVIDSGPGIPPWYLERIFDPFFTTKAPGEGTGLGLSLVHSIVSEHAGEIHVDSEPGKGTAFRIDLPRAPSAAQPPEPADDGTPGRPLRVLVVDDEEAVRRISVRFLERLGHRVETANDGGDALRLLAAEQYDVILSDLRMPGLGGEQLLQHLREQNEGMDRRLILVTGDAASAQAARTLAEAAVPVLVKPVRMQELARVIQTTCSGAGRPA